MKDYFKRLIVETKIGYFFLKFLNILFKFVDRIPYFIFESKIKKELIVKQGPFAGLKYPAAKSYGSVFFPKIMGVYEMQLQKYIMEFKKKKYDKIINIGAAEGYYAVGSAMLFSDTKVFAIDKDKKALSFLAKMAKINGVQDYIKIYDGEVKKFFNEIDPKSKNLIISDCEGCEFDIFSNSSTEVFKNSDLIIEMHYKKKDLTIDFQRNEFIKRFNDNHDVKIVKPIKNNVENYPSLENMAVKYAKRFIQENRSINAEWIIFLSKNFNQNRH